MGKVEQLGVKDYFVAFSSDYHVLHVVIDNFSRHPLQITERIDMTIHERLKSTLVNKFNILSPGITQKHNKGQMGSGANGVGPS